MDLYHRFMIIWLVPVLSLCYYHSRIIDVMKKKAAVFLILYGLLAIIDMLVRQLAYCKSIDMLLEILNINEKPIFPAAKLFSYVYSIVLGILVIYWKKDHYTFIILSVIHFITVIYSIHLFFITADGFLLISSIVLSITLIKRC